MQVSAYGLQRRTAYANEYTTAIDIRKHSGGLTRPRRRQHTEIIDYPQ
ncbi:hypothetical protein O7630_10065 [Micromonospora sp. WMMD718]|nr:MULTISPECIES: hypothetical protein [unclassified Micromonospora]MDG4751285.1 hypothetical protein [Micromonospora sp. WMMD718]